PRLTVGFHWEAKLMGRGAHTRVCKRKMEPNEPLNTKFYQLGNGGELIFEHDLNALSDFLGRPHPEFHGIQVNDQEALARLCGQNVVRILASRYAHLELDNSRAYANQTHLALITHGDAIKQLSRDRNKLRLKCAKDVTITRLRAQIASLEATVKAQEEQLMEIEEDEAGADLRGGDAFLSDDDDRGGRVH
ncbi:hypothetical protein QYE76_052411, partial [Lolium multiflorum]